MKKLLFLTILFSLPCVYADGDFENWKKSYIKRAAKRGLGTTFLNKILSDVEFDETVIKKDNNQVTSSKTHDYQKFIKRWLRHDNKRVTQGIELLIKHKDLLNKVESKYGVSKEVIVALWGTETFYGEITGDYDLVSSLASLSYKSRRKQFFETQLNAALRLIKKGHVTREKLKGSWAGATGQCQFMPSNIPVYAQDFNGDKKKDIWDTKEDIFASIANLLKKAGWKKNSTVGSLAYNKKNIETNTNKYRSFREYNKLGFTDYNGKDLVQGNWSKRRFSKISMKNSPVVLQGGNYKTLMKWNNSSLFAAFVIILSEEFKKQRPNT